MTYIQSHIGGRTENQDFYGSAQTRFGELIIVCDGMEGMVEDTQLKELYK